MEFQQINVLCAAPRHQKFAIALSGQVRYLYEG